MKFLKKDTITQAGALVAGSLAANVIYNKATMIQNAKLRAAAPLLVGLFLSSQKSKMIAAVGCGMIAAGGQKLVGTFVPGLAGIDADDTIEGVYDEIEMNGADDVLNGFDDTLNGPGDDSDFE